MNSMDVPGCRPHSAASSMNSWGSARLGGVGRPSPSTCVATFAVENPKPPAASAAPRRARIAAIWAGLALSVDAAGPMTAASYRRVADHEPDVQRQRLGLDDVEELGEGLPLVVDTGEERLDRYRLDAGEEPGQEVAIIGRRRRQGEAAIAADRRRHAVQRRRAQRRIPEELGVVVGMQVDEPGRDHQPFRIDGDLGLIAHAANFDDAAVQDPHVPLRGGCTGAVHHGTTVNHHIEHASPFVCGWSRLRHLSQVAMPEIYIIIKSESRLTRACRCRCRVLIAQVREEFHGVDGTVRAVAREGPCDAGNGPGLMAYPGTIAATDPERRAVVMGASGQVVTYGQLNDGSIRLARVLRETGLRPGDHFAVMMENHPRYCEVVWAALRAGFYVTAVNAHLTPPKPRSSSTIAGPRFW